MKATPVPASPTWRRGRKQLRNLPIAQVTNQPAYPSIVEKSFSKSLQDTSIVQCWFLRIFWWLRISPSSSFDSCRTAPRCLVRRGCMGQSSHRGKLSYYTVFRGLRQLPVAQPTHTKLLPQSRARRDAAYAPTCFRERVAVNGRERPTPRCTNFT